MKNSQAALDFVMTYGWAIMMVMVAIGALAYFGVLSPDKLVPEKCFIDSGITCLDHLAQFFGPGNGEVTVTLKINTGYDITSVSISASMCSSSTTTHLLKNGDKVTLTATNCNINSGENY